MNIKIDGLWAITAINGDGKPVVYPKLFMKREEADEYAKELYQNAIVVPVFINEK